MTTGLPALTAKRIPTKKNRPSTTIVTGSKRPTTARSTQIAKGDWGSNVTELTNFCTAPDDTLCLYILPPDFVGGPMANGALAAWNRSDLIDLSDEQWNAGDIEFMTKGGNVYGVATGNSEPRQCLYFNKRVLEEAGIDWNTIYDMQADGTWTWEAFEGMLKQIQKDTDNDGVIDIYGMTGSNVDMYRVAVFANGGSFFDFDDKGNLVITAGSDNTLEALAWAKDIWNTYGYQQPADGSWDYYKDAWKQGFCGFYMYQTYGGFNDNSEMADMADEWGCVAFPKGPKGDTYVHIISDNITVIPNVYDADTVNKLAYIYKLWSAATPGYDDEDAWIGNKYNYTDERAVDETYAMLREPEHCVSDKVPVPRLHQRCRRPGLPVEPGRQHSRRTAGNQDSRLAGPAGYLQCQQRPCCEVHLRQIIENPMFPVLPFDRQGAVTAHRGGGFFFA